jgi:hypothetical protein
VEFSPDRPEPVPHEPLPASKSSEDELAREMIERIARQVDLESGVVPRRSEPEPEPEQEATEPADAERAAEPDDEPDLEAADRSEEDVARELIERIAREVDEGKRG